MFYVLKTNANDKVDISQSRSWNWQEIYHFVFVIFPLFFVFYLLTSRKIPLTGRVKEWSSPAMSNAMHCKILPIISVKKSSFNLSHCSSTLFTGSSSPLYVCSESRKLFFSLPGLVNFTVRFYWLICIMNEVILYLVDNTIEDMKLSQLKLET